MSILTHNYKTWVEVSREALENNIRVVRGLLKPETKLLAVVKSNAYGHGLVETAKIFCETGADWLGVDNIDEAILLRESGIKVPILVMGYTPVDRFEEAVKNDLRLTSYNLLPKSLVPNIYPALHLKIDTGMSRQGILVLELSEFLKSLPAGVNIEGVFTHFANADNLDDRSYPNLQLANFNKALKIFQEHDIKPAIRHAVATTGLLTMPEAQLDMVRIGIAFYGLWPSAEFSDKFKKLKLKPTLSWKTRIVQIKNIKTGTPVGYGINENVKKDTKIAVLPVGYYDGYDRALSSVGEVLIDGKRCKILGRVSMNLVVADATNVKNTNVGDEVVLIGEQGKERIVAEELAGKIGTISYEVVSRINPLLPRIYI